MSFVTSGYIPPQRPSPFARPVPEWHPTPAFSAHGARETSAVPGASVPHAAAAAAAARSAHAARVSAAKVQRRTRAAAAHCRRRGMGDAFGLNMFGVPSSVGSAVTAAPVPGAGTFLNTSLFSSSPGTPAGSGNAAAPGNSPSQPTAAGSASGFQDPNSLLVPGSSYTLFFAPTGLGNPMDSATGWYSALSKLPDLTVSNVVLNSGVLTTKNIAVVIGYRGPKGGTYASVGAQISGAMGGALYGYQFMGGWPGSNTHTPGSPNGSSGLAWWAWLAIGAGGLLVLKSAMK